MNFQEAMKLLLEGKEVRRPVWNFWVKLGNIQAVNPRKDTLQFNFPIVQVAPMENYHIFFIDDVVAQDYEVREEGKEEVKTDDPFEKEGENLF